MDGILTIDRMIELAGAPEVSMPVRSFGQHSLTHLLGRINDIRNMAGTKKS
jgi:hypothetical protein